MNIHLRRHLKAVLLLTIIALFTLSSTLSLAQDQILVRGYIAAQVGQSGIDKERSMFFAGAKQQQIHLPNVDVFLRNVNGSGESTVSKTDLSGRFSVYVKEPGKYQLCWKSKVYGSNCLSRRTTINVGKKPRFLSTVNILIERLNRHSGLIGKVAMANGDNVRHFEPYLNLNSFAKIRLLDQSGNIFVEVPVNNAGYYFLPNVPVKQSMTIEASIEAEKIRQSVEAGARLNGNSIYQVNLKFSNHAPQVKNISVVGESGDRAQNPSPGETVTLLVNASDKDGDRLSYRWQDTEIVGKISANNKAEIKWKLPESRGRHILSVLVYDKRGGYDKQSISLLADGDGIPFGGIIVDVQGNPIADAVVQLVGNNVVKTNQRGRFNIRVKESERYVFNVRKAGFALNSRVYDRSVSNGRWVLVKGQIITVNPLVKTTISHDRSKKECTGPSSATASLGVAGNSLLTPQWQDGKGNIIDAPASLKSRPKSPVFDKPVIIKPKADFFTRFRNFFNFKPQVEPERIVLKPFDNELLTKETNAAFVMPRNIDLRPCGPGVSVTLDAESVVDKNGDVVTTPFDVTISTVDVLSPQQMPGDESVIPIGGGGGYIESFGAGSLDLPKGFSLSKPAEVVIAVDRSRNLDSSALPATVPYLSYDEEKGLWIEESVMTLKTVNGVSSYVGVAKHFSAFNADNVKDANASCIRVFSPDLPGNYDLEVAAPIGNNGAIKILKKPIDNSMSTEHVIYNLPSQSNITLAPMSQGANPQLYGYFIVNSGPSQSPSNSPNVPPGAPYDSCNNEITLTIGQAPNAPLGGEFLNGIGFIGASNLGIDDDLTVSGPIENDLREAIVTASRNYYESIDPAGDFDTFDKFRTQHGFSLDPTNPAVGEIVVSYANSGDLGFGRDMHCRENGGNYACYVTNYGFGYDNNNSGGGGTPDVDDADAAASRSTVGGSAEIATVAMEYTTIAGQANRIVKFYVYKKDFPSAGEYARSISANLDGRGERPVPQLCMVCHGGNIPSHSDGVPVFSTPAQVDLNARFVPFDHRFFTFPSGLAPSDDEEDAIRDLNQLIVDLIPAGAPANDPIREVISKMYSGVLPDHQNINSTVDGWDTGNSANVANQKEFYDDVFTSACRMCHIAQPFESLQFQRSEQFLHLDNNLVPGNNFLMLGTVQSRVCGDYLMPHALRTHDLFWGRYTDNIDPAFIAPNLQMSTRLQSFGDAAVGANQGLTWQAGLCSSFISTNVSNPSNFYQQTIQPIFNSKCVGCHIAGSQAGFLPLTDGASLPNLLLNNRVIPGDDNNGALINRITESNLGASRMPPNCFRAPEAPNGNLPCLLPAEVEKIKVWIRSGAN